MSAAGKSHSVAPRLYISGTAEHIQGLRFALTFARSEMLTRLANSRREVKHFAVELEKHPDDRHISEMLLGWQEHLANDEARLADITQAFERLQQAQIVQHGEKKP